MSFMSSNNLQRRIKGLGIAFSLMFGFVLMSAVSASAQYYPQDNQQNRQDDRRDRARERRDDYNRNRDNDRRNNDGYYGNNGNYGGYGNGSNVARQEGYRDGLAAGRDDARDGERYKPQNHSDYKKGTDGYNSRYGNKGQYKQIYRDAFMQGYNQAYRNNQRGYRRGY